MMSKLTKAEIEKIAKLAMIELSDEELEKFSKQLTSILDYVNKLSEVDTKDINYKSHVDIVNQTRDDEAGESLSVNDAVSQTNNENGYIVVPKVLDE